METKETVDARKRRLGFADGRKLLEEADELYALRGKKVERFDLRTGLPDEETLRRVLLGPTGNLRAPAFRVGRTVVVGFEEETYQRLLGAGRRS